MITWLMNSTIGRWVAAVGVGVLAVLAVLFKVKQAGRREAEGDAARRSADAVERMRNADAQAPSDVDAVARRMRDGRF